jgi:hypothetical protein
MMRLEVDSDQRLGGSNRKRPRTIASEIPTEQLPDKKWEASLGAL